MHTQRVMIAQLIGFFLECDRSLSDIGYLLVILQTPCKSWPEQIRKAIYIRVKKVVRQVPQSFVFASIQCCQALIERLDLPCSSCLDDSPSGACNQL